MLAWAGGLHGCWEKWHTWIINQTRRHSRQKASHGRVLMHANVYLFWGQVEPRTEPSRQWKEREREKENTYLFNCSPIAAEAWMYSNPTWQWRQGEMGTTVPADVPRCDMESDYQGTSAAMSPRLRSLDLSYKRRMRDILEHMANVWLAVMWGHALVFSSSIFGSSPEPHYVLRL